MIDNSDHFLLPLLQFEQWVDEGAKESVRPMGKDLDFTC